MVIAQPHHRIIADIAAHLIAPVIWPGGTPGRFCSPVIVEIDPAPLIFRPAIEFPEIKITWAEVVVNDIEDDRYSVLVSRFHQALQSKWAAVAALHRVRMRGIIPP